MIFSFIMLALLTTAAVGLPAIWLINNSLDQQAWAQVDQGVRASRALFSDRKTDAIDLATLTAQRPTMGNLLAQNDRETLPHYLNTLRVGAGFDSIRVCDSEDRIMAEAGEALPLVGCNVINVPGYYVFSTDDGTIGRLIATSLIVDDGIRLGRVVIGRILNSKFAADMRDQTGLEHTFLAEGFPIATSLAVSPDSLTTLIRHETLSTVEDEQARIVFDLESEPYYATRLPLNDTGLETELALEVGEIVATRQRLVWGLAGAILAVAAVGSFLGAYIARRIGMTFDELTEAASAFSKGDLETPVTVGSRVHEATLVAQALDGARIDLRMTLNQLRQEKKWSDHLLEAIVEGIVALDDRGRITFFSPGAEGITGWNQEQVLNRACDEFFKPIETKEEFTELIPQPGQRRRIMVELAGGKDAMLAVTRARLAPSKADEAEVVFVFRDISEEETVHRLMGHFMANVSHEFRTPLAALAASIELLIDQASDLSTGELQELLGSLHLGILGLQTLVDNLLESASIETGHFRVSPRPVGLADIIADAVGIMQPLMDKHEQHLVVELPVSIPVVYADPRRTTQVMVNLLSNANKYSPGQSEVLISVAVENGWARIIVADQGPGVPPEHRDSVFRRFSYRVLDNGGTHYGAGLGLSVVKAVIEALGGEVGVSERTDGGSAFWFTLPVVSEQ